MQTYTKILTLNSNYVNLLTQIFYTDEDGNMIQLGHNTIQSYINTSSDRDRLRNDISEPYFSQIMRVWGGTPTLTLEDLFE